ncbi:FAD-dependent oxidoreductase [Bremerella cremea]|uniref:FAD-dependent oxidoreductase n=1 Tax=Bremerella cremea TaxID=1031537 RepID=A0A368KS82_9BACT|nr:FAD-dependent oxidoreductase [Bremerella cremea]RCS50607.1 FAD-dependent oxidoreductase [Bremerella cremea]
MLSVRLLFTAVLSLVLAGLSQGQLFAETKSVDVVVYGATPGGVCAAIAAAREGASVILLEPTSHVGGVNTGGLSFSDSNQTVRSTVMGLFDEWHRRIEDDYRSRGVKLPYDVSVKDNSKWTYEPHVAMRVTKAMLKEAGVDVLTQRELKSVRKEDATIVEIETTGGSYAAKTFVDATYEGDLMAAAGVQWTIGREGKAAFGESLAGKRYPKGRMKLSGFDAQGNLLPLVTTSELGNESEGDDRVMVYSFRLCLTSDPANRIPFPKPEHYDPARFEVVRRYAKSGGTSFGIDLYPLPGNKLDGNNSIGGQFSLGLVGACNGWSEGDAQRRAEIFEAHRQYTLEFYHFLTTDQAVPEEVRKKYAALGLCRDEFPDTDHWPPQLYVREGRRMQGMYVVSEDDILKNPTKEDPIVVSSFPIDSHDCQRVAFEDGTVADEGTIFPVRMPGRRHGYAYHIPYRAILPQANQCDNLLVPVALSCTHVGISSIRVEPTWMILGQSAGIAAAVAAEDGVTVQDLPYERLKKRLLAQGQVLELPKLPELPEPSNEGSIPKKSLAGIVLDDTDAQLEGAWSHSTNFKPNIEKGYVHDEAKGDGLSRATFKLSVPKSGRYLVLMAYSPHPTRAKNVPVRIHSGGKEVLWHIDQTQPLPTGKMFREIGQVALSADGDTVIDIGNEGTDGFVILDALQLIPVAP